MKSVTCFAVLCLLLLSACATNPSPPLDAQAAQGWQFDRDGDTEGWTFNNGFVNPTVKGGALSFGITGVDPWMFSAAISVPAANNNTVVIRMKNETPNTTGKIYWETASEPAFSEPKSQTFALVPNDGGTTEYRVDLRAVSSWSGTITRLRVDPAENPGSGGPMSIDSVDFAFNDEPIEDPSEGDRQPVPHIGVIETVAVDEARITVQGTVDDPAALGGRTLELYELAPYQYEPDYKSALLLASQAGSLSSPAFSFSVDRFDGARDRYYSKFLVVARDPAGDAEAQFVDNPKYVTDLRFSAKYAYPYPTARSKKGLQVQMVDDAEELGIGHAGINLAFERLMLSGPGNAVSYEMDGKTYYFERDYLEELDAQIKPLSDNDVIVNLILILYDSNEPNSAIDKLIHPDAARGQGTVYAFNTANDEGVEYVKAAMEFVTERYTRPDEAYGRVVGYIVGNEVDAQWVWQNMGEKTLNQFMDNYERTVRVVYQAARKHYDNARVYISLTHFWNTSLNPGQPTRYYKGRDVIDKMNELSKENGDFPWFVAHHPYPEDLFDPATWNDTTATDSVDSERVTFKNLHILPQYLAREQLRFDGEPRRIILSEQGFHTPNLSAEAQRLQAAAYAYAYYKVLFNESIDSFILHRHVDHKIEGGLRLGLWSWDDDRPEPSSPDEKKAIYEVFQKIDTEASVEVTEFAKSIIGISDWRQVTPNFDEGQLAQRVPPRLVGVQFIGKSRPDAVIDDFDGGLGEWEEAENADEIERSSDAFGDGGALQVNFNALAKLWRGAVVSFGAPVNASSTPYLSLALKLPSFEASDRYYAKVKVYRGLEVAEGVVTLNPSKGWNAIALDLRSWEGRSAVDRIKVWVRSDTNKDWEGALLIDEVAFSRNVVPQPGRANLQVTATANSSRLAEGAEVAVEVSNYGSDTLRGPLTIVPSETLTFDEQELDVSGLGTGTSRTFTLTITEYRPPASGESATLRFRYRSQVQESAIQLAEDPTGEAGLPDTLELLYNFEGDVQGWSPGENVSSVGVAQGFPNAPGTPRLGQYVLAPQADTVAATEYRAVYVEPSTPLDLTGATAFFYHINAYGGLPNASYESRITLYSGEETLTETVSIDPDAWNEVRLDVSNWEGRSRVTRIELAFRALGFDEDWNGQFQLDFVGYEKVG